MALEIVDRSLPILRDICYCMGESSDEAGLGAGGRMRQKITADRMAGLLDAATTSDCTVRLCLADDWLRLTGTPPPHKPPSAQVYSAFGLPWFDYDNGIRQSLVKRFCRPSSRSTRSWKRRWALV